MKAVMQLGCLGWTVSLIASVWVENLQVGIISVTLLGISAYLLYLCETDENLTS